MKKNAIYAIILTILIVTLYFVGIPKNEETKQNESKSVFQLDKKEKDINSISIKSADKNIIIEKKNDKWNITSPKNYPTDQHAVQQVIQTFINLKSEKTLKDDNLSQYGLDKPSVSFSIKTNDNKQYTIFRGNKAIDGANYYAKTGTPNEVLLIIRADLEDTGLDKSVKDLRDKDFLKIKEEDIISIKIKDFELTKNNKEWSINSIEKDKIDTNKVDEFINDVINIKASNFIEDDDKKSEILFDKENSFRLSIKTKNSSKIIDLCNNKGLAYAKIDDNPTIYEISTYIFESVNVGKNHFLAQKDENTKIGSDKSFKDNSNIVDKANFEKELSDIKENDYNLKE